MYICFLNRMFRGASAEGVDREVSSIVESALLCELQSHTRRKSSNLTQPQPINIGHRAKANCCIELALLSIASQASIRRKQLKQKEKCGDSGSIFSSRIANPDGTSAAIKEPPPLVSDAGLVRGILPSLRFVVHRQQKHQQTPLPSSTAAASSATSTKQQQVVTADMDKAPDSTTVDARGNDFGCKLCGRELSNMYFHCKGCDLLLAEDFNICGSCYECGDYRMHIAMDCTATRHPASSSSGDADIVVASIYQHTGGFVVIDKMVKKNTKKCGCTLRLQVQAARKCAECKFCIYCECQCHHRFIEHYRTMTPQALDEVLSSAEEESLEDPPLQRHSSGAINSSSAATYARLESILKRLEAERRSKSRLRRRKKQQKKRRNEEEMQTTAASVAETTATATTEKLLVTVKDEMDEGNDDRDVRTTRSPASLYPARATNTASAATATSAAAATATSADLRRDAACPTNLGHPGVGAGIGEIPPSATARETASESESEPFHLQRPQIEVSATSKPCPPQKRRRVAAGAAAAAAAAATTTTTTTGHKHHHEQHRAMSLVATSNVGGEEEEEGKKNNRKGNSNDNHSSNRGTSTATALTSAVSSSSAASVKYWNVHQEGPNDHLFHRDHRDYQHRDCNRSDNGKAAPPSSSKTSIKYSNVCQEGPNDHLFHRRK